MAKDVERNLRRAEDARAAIEFEDDPHRAALEDDPEHTEVSFKTWLAIFSMAASFGPAVGLGFTVVAAVVVQITNDLGNDADLAWVVGAWSLSTACSFSLGGPLSDIFGRRDLILGGQAVVMIGCIVGGVAKNVATLIASETVIGLGTGFVFVAYAGVPEMLPNKWRALGVGILEGGIMVPWGMVGVLLGAALLEYASWRWIFYLGIIVEGLALVGTALCYWPTSRPRGDFDKTRWQQFKEVDWIGLSLFTLGLATALVGLTWGGSPDHPWKSASSIVPIVLGVAVVALAFVYDFNFAKAPLFPAKLFRMWRGFVVLLIGLFISGMNFHAMSALFPQGSLFMFTTDSIQIGLISLPTNLISTIVGALVPICAHRIGHIKWLFAAGMAFQAIFMGASAATVNPNNRWAWTFVPAFGVPMFLMVTILGYAIASLHVPHSHLGVAMGLLGTFRSAGGAVGNAIFNTVFQDKFRAFSGEEITKAALASGLNAADLGAIIPGTIAHNLGVPHSLDGIEGMTPAIAETLRSAVRLAYGRSFQFVFYITIPFSVIALICSFWVEDPEPYMTNHVQSAMNNRVNEKVGLKDGLSQDGIEVENVERAREPNTIG
ncbi:MFS domain-containing protein [Fusarium keratoplasticum]|uniref:MFS domain-containing protein n=1 Tax=Fusarium keratoplasticum TaxID=1328300 RepID=A0ACC0QTU3_9HYPO|nr:MFS domain-containing protein [Fusarium keratoplasticum]KAI8663428.1 MFS domain-containing protein [Fusarium keratoplasticum]